MLNEDSMIAYVTYNRQIKFSNIHEHVVVFETDHMKLYHRGTRIQSVIFFIFILRYILSKLLTNKNIRVAISSCCSTLLLTLSVGEVYACEGGGLPVVTGLRIGESWIQSQSAIQESS